MSFAEVQVLIEENRELLRGPKGVKGDRGEVGKSIKGDPGERGPAGKSITGPRGLPGKDGRDGADGKSVTGPAGKAGPPGKDGVGPDEKVRVSSDDPKAGFLADKLTAGSGIEIRTAGGKRGERLVIDARPQGGGGGGQSGIIAYDDGVAVGAGNKVSFDGGDPVTIAGGIIRVPVGSGAGGDFIPQGGPLTEDLDADGVVILSVGLQDATLANDLDAAGHHITDLASPNDPGDAVNKSYVDDNFLSGTDADAAYAPIGAVPIEALDEGSSLTAAATSFDFVGAVTATAVGNAVTVTVPGGAGTGDLDAVLTAGNDGGALGMTNVGVISGLDDGANTGAFITAGDADAGDPSGGDLAASGGTSEAGNQPASFIAHGGNDDDNAGGSLVGIGGPGVVGAKGGNISLTAGVGDNGNFPGAVLNLQGGSETDNGYAQITTDGDTGVLGEVLGIGASGYLEYLPVLAGSAQTYTESNVVTDRAFDATSMTLNEMANILGSLIVDLRARGVVA